MTRKSRTLLAVAVVIVLGLVLLDWQVGIFGGHGHVVDALVEKNIQARGGADAWRAVSTLRLEGRMDLGQGLNVPYVLEQKRPDKMCLDFVFANQKAVQCVDGKAGWQILPFRGQEKPAPMRDPELTEMRDTASIDGLLFDSDERGYRIKLVGHEMIDGRDTKKLEVRLPGGSTRWVYLDTETGLETKLVTTRKLRGKDLLVETVYSDWQDTAGLLIPRRQETLTEGDAESHFLTVDRVMVNPPIADARFAMPSAAADPSRRNPS
jgi:hypothetical protein